MTKRGDELREQMLWCAKDVFLDFGFERASMDVIAARAGTTKRSLYAHFDSKERLFLAVVELVRGLYLGHLRTPGDYADDPEEALVQFCARFLELLIWDRPIRMHRISIAEVSRFPAGAIQQYESTFETAQGSVEALLRERFQLSGDSAKVAATELLGRVLYPRFTRALYGLEVLPAEHRLANELGTPLDVKPIRAAVSDVLGKTRR